MGYAVTMMPFQTTCISVALLPLFTRGVEPRLRWSDESHRVKLGLIYAFPPSRTLFVNMLATCSRLGYAAGKSFGLTTPINSR